MLGGGISGLAAAHRLAAEPGVEVIVMEASGRLGGKIKSSDFDGRAVDEGGDAFLTQGGHALELCRALGLDDQLVAPSTNRAWLWKGGRLQPFPPGLMLGVPIRPLKLLGSPLIGTRAALRAGLDFVMPRNVPRGDVSVARLVRSRLGAEVASTLVEPLIGGINAGRAECLGTAATAPRLAAAREHSRSLIRGLNAEQSLVQRDPSVPPFLGLRGGMGEMVSALERTLRERGAQIRLDCRVAAVERSGEGWVLRSRATSPGAGRATPVEDRPAVAGANDSVRADGIVVALPAWEAASVLEGPTPLGSGLLRKIPYASVAMLTMSYEESAVSEPLPEGSGFLVPPVEHRAVTACSWASAKWPHLGRPGEVLLRASVGRWGDGAALMLDDETLAKAVDRELASVLGLAGGPTATRVTRWNRAFPQFGVGHSDLVEEIERAVRATGPAVLAGAAYGGVGIPACIRSGYTAADRMLSRL